MHYDQRFWILDLGSVNLEPGTWKLELLKMDKLDCIVIGAGVIGLAVARVMAMSGREVFILEATEGIGNEASSRNSEVIHAGIYYLPGSLKAKLCVRGKQLLYQYCAERGINYERIGKIIVASDEGEVQDLERLRSQAKQNGVDDLVLLTGKGADSLEPELNCAAGLLSPSTGIIDSHSLMEEFLADSKDSGAELVLGTKVEGGRILDDGIVLEVGGSEPMTVLCRTVINCGGIHASDVAHSIEGISDGSIPPSFMCKGSYFALSGSAPFEHLIYPIPDEGGLGIHLTFDLAGKVRFGPDTEWVDSVDYAVDPGRASAFSDSIRRYWPGLSDTGLNPDYSGIRAKIVGPDEEAADFMIQGSETHGIAGLVNLYGIESPGLTASMAIAEEVVKLAGVVET